MSIRISFTLTLIVSLCFHLVLFSFVTLTMTPRAVDPEPLIVFWGAILSHHEVAGPTWQKSTETLPEPLDYPSPFMDPQPNLLFFNKPAGKPVFIKSLKQEKAFSVIPFELDDPQETPEKVKEDRGLNLPPLKHIPLKLP